MKPRRWTPIRVGKLRRIAERGGTVKDAMQHFGLTYAAIREAADRHGVVFERRPWRRRTASIPPGNERRPVSQYAVEAARAALAAARSEIASGRYPPYRGGEWG